MMLGAEGERILTAATPFWGDLSGPDSPAAGVVGPEAAKMAGPTIRILSPEAIPQPGP